MSDIMLKLRMAEKIEALQRENAYLHFQNNTLQRRVEELEAALARLASSQTNDPPVYSQRQQGRR